MGRNYSGCAKNVNHSHDKWYKGLLLLRCHITSVTPCRQVGDVLTHSSDPITSNNSANNSIFCFVCSLSKDCAWMEILFPEELGWVWRRRIRSRYFLRRTWAVHKARDWPQLNAKKTTDSASSTVYGTPPSCFFNTIVKWEGDYSGKCHNPIGLGRTRETKKTRV